MFQSMHACMSHCFSLCQCCVAAAPFVMINSLLLHNICRRHGLPECCAAIGLLGSGVSGSSQNKPLSAGTLLGSMTQSQDTTPVAV